MGSIIGNFFSFYSPDVFFFLSIYLAKNLKEWIPAAQAPFHWF